MPRIRYSLAAEITKPLSIPGSPDVQGEIVVEVASGTISSGSGLAYVSGWATTSVSPDRLDLPRTAVEIKARRVAVPVSNAKATGTIVVQLWASWEKADATGLMRAQTGILKGRDIEVVGTLGLIDATAWEPGTEDVVDLPPAPPAPTGKVYPHATTFLRRNASISSHVLMSDKLTDAKRQEIIDYNKAQGYGVLYVYCANEGDYDKQGVSYDRSKRELWRKWLGKVIESGSRVIMWGCADDSNNLAKRTHSEWRAYWGMVHADVGDLVSEWVTGLECDERWSAGETQALTRLLKEITGKPVGVHTTGLSKIGHAAGADKFYLQDTSRNAAKVSAAVRSAKKQFGGTVIAAELHLSGDTAEARALGDAAIDAGADGVGTGCTAAGIARLIQAATGGGSTSPDAPTVHPTVPPGPALTFRYVGRSLKDVAWSPDVDRSNKDIWPVKDVNDKPCNARLHGCRVGEKMRGIEWIKVGASSAHTVNAWAAPGTKYGQSFKPGDRCRFEIRDINNRVVDPSLAGECVLG